MLLALASTMVTRKQVDAITRWKCPCCVIKSLNVPGYSLNIKCDSCENLVAKVGEQIDHLKSEIGELQDLKRSFAEIETEKFEQQRLWSEVVRSTDGNNKSFTSTLAKELVDESNKLMHDKESREKNVLLFNAEELTSDDGKERKKHDQHVFEVLSKHVVNKVLPTEKMYRIGKREPVNNNDVSNSENGDVSSRKKIRPIKVCFLNSFDKRTFLANLYKLKQSSPDLINNIKIQHDLTVEERKITKDLLSEAYNKNQTESPVDFLYKVRGPPHALKVVKVFHTR